jgi:hypothetical protein
LGFFNLQRGFLLAEKGPLGINQNVLKGAAAAAAAGSLAAGVAELPGQPPKEQPTALKLADYSLEGALVEPHHHFEPPHHRRHHKHHYQYHIPNSENKHPHVMKGPDSKIPFTATWWRCVITPESSGDFNATSGGFGILVSTWHYYGQSGVPGDATPKRQGKIALEIYDDNHGFGPNAWNNAAGCGKDG